MFAGTDRRRLLLLSNSTQHGHGYLDHAADVVDDHFGDARRIAFVPYALHDWDAYTETVTSRFARLGRTVVGVHTSERPADVVADCDCVFVGGGNTFRLVAGLHQHQLVETLRSRVSEGMPYVGASAGTNVACPSIRTTNDMPIVEPPSFTALALVGFHINSHYLDAPVSATHMGETRSKRLVEYLEENTVPVVGLPEGSWIRAEGRQARVGGAHDAVLFAHGETHGNAETPGPSHAPQPLPLGSELTSLEPWES